MAYKTHIVLDVDRSQALDVLLEAASEQAGYVTAAQATRLGLSRDDIARLTGSGDLQRVRRGVFRMRHGRHRREDDIAAWLHFEDGRLPWERRGTTNVVISHGSAAALHNLGSVIPRQATVTLPSDSTTSTPRVKDIDVHRAPLRDVDWAWADVDDLRLPVTTPARTIVDLLGAGEERSYVERAIAETLAARLATTGQIMDAAQHRRPTRTRGLQTEIARLLKAST